MTVSGYFFICPVCWPAHEVELAATWQGLNCQVCGYQRPPGQRMTLAEVALFIAQPGHDCGEDGVIDAGHGEHTSPVNDPQVVCIPCGASWPTRRSYEAERRYDAWRKAPRPTRPPLPPMTGQQLSLFSEGRP